MPLPHDMVIFSFMLFGKKHGGVIFMNIGLQRLWNEGKRAYS